MRLKPWYVQPPGIRESPSRISLDPALPAFIRTDRDRLRQTLILLLGAAVSHAKSEVFFRLDLNDKGLHFVISSDGQRFPDPPQAIFEPFHDGVLTARPPSRRAAAGERAGTGNRWHAARGESGRPAHL